MAKQKNFSKDSYELICCKVKELLNVANSEYLTNKHLFLRRKNKKIWEILNGLLGKNGKIFLIEST